MKKYIQISLILFQTYLLCVWGQLYSQPDEFGGYLSPISDVFGVQIGGYHDIVEDWNGFIWMATKSGLLRIDGTQAKVFTQSKTDSTLAHKIVYDILVDEENQMLWLATGKGITVFDPKTEESRHYQASFEDKRSLADNVVRSLYKDSEGKIWAGCFNYGLSLFVEESDDFENFYYKESNIDSLQAIYPV